MNKPFVFLSLITCCSHSQADLFQLSNPTQINEYQNVTLHTRAHYIEANQYTKQREYQDQWSSYHPEQGINLALLNSRAEIGMAYQNWRISALYRKETMIAADKDTLDLIYFNQHKQAAPTSQMFNLDLALNSFEAKGIRLEKAVSFMLSKHSELRVGAGVSWLQGMSNRQAQIHGQAQATATGYNYQFDFIDSDSRDNYPFIRPAQVDGNGYAFDFAASMKWQNGLQLDFIANDLAAKMHWHNMPHSKASANSANINRDAAGYIYYAPLLTGQNDLNRRDITQTLHPKLHLEMSQRFDNWTVSAGSSWTQQYYFPQLGLGYHFSPTWQSKVNYESRFESFALSLEHPSFYLRLRHANSAYGLGLGLNWDL